MRLLWGLVGLAIGDLAAVLLAPAPEPPRVLIPCVVKEIHDGDTITVDVLFPWSVGLRDQVVRFQQFDAWEVTKTRQTVEVTDAEIKKGIAARDDLKDLLATAETVYLSPGEHKDPYGRLPAYPFVWDGKKLIDVGNWMNSRGHSRKGQ